MARKKRKLPVVPDNSGTKSWAVAGVDISIQSMSGAMLVYDARLDKMRGPGVFSKRWERPAHFLDRLAEASFAGDFMYSVMSAVGPMHVETDNIWVGVEEAWPAGIVRRAESGWLRQQAQIQGAFLGGLRRWKYHRIYEVNAQSWRKVVADDLDVKVNREFTKWTVKEWALSAFEGVPDLPDLIKHDKRGLIPKPDTSKARPVQPNDIYDALGIMAWMQNTREIEVGD